MCMCTVYHVCFFFFFSFLCVLVSSIDVYLDLISFFRLRAVILVLHESHTVLLVLGGIIEIACV